jgi:transmembrane sensor
MVTTSREIEDAAIGWVVRLREADERDWAEFTAWLEADPAHGVAYEEAALADDEAEEVLPPQRPEPMRPVLAPAASRPAHRFGRRAFFGWGVAASLVLGLGYAGMRGGTGQEVIQTAAGETRSVQLADGSRIAVNGDTRLVIDGKRPRFARLERGEALFHVVHDPARPFEVEAGDAVIRDLGTVFNVVREEGALEVAVAEGAVVYNPGREARSLTPGMALRKPADAPVEVTKVDAAMVGSWRDQRLVYSGATLARIAADLSRSTGLRISAAPEVAGRPFSGVIMLGGERQEVLERAAALLGVGLRRSGQGWIFTRAGATI